MGSSTNTPQIIAGGDISPLRAVNLSAAWTAVQSDAETDAILGFVDASTKAHDSALHASSGLPITLQSGPLYRCTAGDAITAGAVLSIDSSGRVIPIAATTGTVWRALIALEAAAAAGDDVWVIERPGFVKLS